MHAAVTKTTLAESKQTGLSMRPAQKDKLLKVTVTGHPGATA